MRRRFGSAEEAVHTLGQLIWRYHPETRRYEVFAEGGGNAFGVEIDRKGRIYSGHNGGDTRGFHYVQGGYYRKGFDKHGPLSNPYTFGYFDAMKHAKSARFTHNFVIGWFVRHVFDAPEWRWLGLNQANCGLTIIRIRSAKPPVLVAHNDLAHLPAELRTGLPEPQPI